MHDDLLRDAAALLADERDPIANAANLAALISASLPDLNWAGFYFVRERELVLGPFVGKPACTRIAFGRGVCGMAWATRTTQVVADVHAFADHIACDAASQSELVVPLLAGDGGVIGVLDLDSPVGGRFGDRERTLLESLAAAYVAGSDVGSVYAKP